MTQQPVPSAPVTDVGGEVETLLASHVKSLTLEQKVRLLTGADFWSHPEPDIGLRTGSRTLGRRPPRLGPEDGAFRLEVGRSSGDLALTGTSRP
jgi:hypothetical protein